jgi:hypothetical protein
MPQSMRSDEVLGFPPVHRGLGQAQLGGALYLLADELARMQELARIEAAGREPRETCN